MLNLALALLVRGHGLSTIYSAEKRGTMETFTLSELRANLGLVRTMYIVELSSGAFTLESRQPVSSTTFVTREEAEAVLQAEVALQGDGLADAKVEVIKHAEAVYDEDGLRTLKEIEPQSFVVEGYMVSRLEEEFATREEAQAVLSEAAKSFAEALYHELTNKSALPVIEVINTDGGHITVREGPVIGRWYTFTDANGEEQCSANSLSLLSYSVAATRGVPPVA